MKVLIGLPLIAWLLATACSHGSEDVSKKLRAGSTEVTFATRDGGRVFGDFYKATGKAKGLVLMFHQARSNSTEYAPIAPKVAGLGYDCLAVDLRSGGDMFDAINRTAANYQGDPGYDAAYSDMLGALDWATTKGYDKVLVWGSSYSASLAIRMAGESPKVGAVLAFSPGEYFKAKNVVSGWSSKDGVPTLMAFTADERKQGGDALFADLKTTAGNVVVSSEQGVHGSSTLRPDSNPGEGSKYYWQAVEDFLRKNG